MDKNKKVDIRISVENALYEHTTDDATLDDIEGIRQLFNLIIDDFIKENNIVQWKAGLTKRRE